MEFLRQNQLTIMLAMASMCALLSLFTFISNSDSTSKGRKKSLLNMSVSAMILLIADRHAYFFRGNTTTFGFYMVRITNFLVFFMTLMIGFSFNNYLIDLIVKDTDCKEPPKRLVIAKYVFFIGVAILIISQFTGIYYTFDDSNIYIRSGGFWISYIFPFALFLLELSTLIEYRKRIRARIFYPLIVFTVLPIVASIAQLFMYGISFTNMTIVGLVVSLRIFAVNDMNKHIIESHMREIQLLEAEQENERLMIYQTTEAFAEAIDAKEHYTAGHSKRVAKYATMLARKAGKTPKEIENIYLVGIMHDVGKIGIPDEIINKPCGLTDEEYRIIKNHTTMGYHILKKIGVFPELSLGAHYHHERFDGKGYPEGLKGEEIPEIARLIAVADTYDAMASKRSYRDILPQEVIREEIQKGSGTQFDPKYAQLMVELIDEDKNYRLKQK